MQTMNWLGAYYIIIGSSRTKILQVWTCITALNESLYNHTNFINRLFLINLIILFEFVIVFTCSTAESVSDYLWRQWSVKNQNRHETTVKHRRQHKFVVADYYSITRLLFFVQPLTTLPKSPEPRFPRQFFKRKFRFSKNKDKVEFEFCLFSELNCCVSVTHSNNLWSILLLILRLSQIQRYTQQATWVNRGHWSAVQWAILPWYLFSTQSNYRWSDLQLNLSLGESFRQFLYQSQEDYWTCLFLYGRWLNRELQNTADTVCLLHLSGYFWLKVYEPRA